AKGTLGSAPIGCRYVPTNSSTAPTIAALGPSLLRGSSCIDVTFSSFVRLNCEPDGDSSVPERALAVKPDAPRESEPSQHGKNEATEQGTAQGADGLLLETWSSCERAISGIRSSSIRRVAASRSVPRPPAWIAGTR